MKKMKRLLMVLIIVCFVGNISMPQNVSASEDYKAWAQKDSRWASLYLGSAEGGTVGDYGCAAVAVTKLIIQCGLRSESSYNVATFVNAMNSAGGFITSGSNAGCIYWSKPASCVSGFNYASNITCSGSSSSKDSTLISWIKSGYHLVINVGGHYVAVDESRSLSNGQIYIMDSLQNTASNVGVKLSSRYSTIYGVFAYTGGSTAQTTYDPQGCFDSAVGGTGTVTVSGWAFDKDVPTQSIAVHVYVGGPAGSSNAECFVLTANQTRADVGNAYPGVGNSHGFSGTLQTTKTGSVSVYIYAINAGGGTNNPQIGSKTVTITKDTTKPTISNAKITDVTKSGYTVTCTVSDNVKVSSVKFPTWTLSGDQDDLVWHTGSISGNTATCYIKTSDHKNEMGTYITDIYAYDLAGNQSDSVRTSTKVKNISVADTTPPSVSDVKVTKDSTGYTVTCTVADDTEVDRVMFPTWSLNKGQDDLSSSWQTAAAYKGTVQGNKVTYRVNISAHNNEKGTYMTHIYAYDIYGNVKAVRCPYTRIEDLDSSAIIEKDGNRYARYDEPLSWQEAEAYCEQLGGHLVIISSQTENDLVQALVEKGTKNYYYIGLTDKEKEGTWKYITGETAGYLNWDSANGEPGGSTNENYACMLAKKNTTQNVGKWTDIPDRITNSGYANYLNSGFVCEFEKTSTNTASGSQKISSIKISSISNKIAAGKKVKLEADVSPAKASDTKLIWRSSNTKVATVDQNGVVTFKKGSGGKTVVITATATDGSGRRASFRLKSMKGIVKKIRIKGKRKVKAGRKLKLKAKVKATKGANKKLLWKSSNTKYATVNAKGVVKAKKAGKGKKVKITAMATDGSGKKATVKIKIK